MDARRFETWIETQLAPELQPGDVVILATHWLGFRIFGGIPERGTDGNMRIAVDRVGRDKELQVNIRSLEMANHYVFAPAFCNPVAGWEKAQPEKSAKYPRPRLWQPVPNTVDLPERNALLERRCQRAVTINPTRHAARNDC